MTGFDTVLIVDWSGGNDRGPKPVADAIWVGVMRGINPDPPVYLRNRDAALGWLIQFFDAENAAGRRVLAGFDFPFAYPDGFGQVLTGSKDPLAVWEWLRARIHDNPKANNRFEVAAQINQMLGQDGPFWGNAASRDFPGLSRKKPLTPSRFAQKRATEKLAKGSFSCWQLAGAGAVGSQMLMGLPILAQLRERYGSKLAVWPFEAPAPLTIAEVWPSATVPPPPEGMIKDAWQVQETARMFKAMDPQTLSELLDISSPTEGWILGIPAPRQLRNDCFALPAGVHWTPVQEALSLLKERMQPVTATQTLALGDAMGRIAARDVIAQRSNPPLANTAVDGYGFCGGRGDGLQVLPLAQGRAAAGDAPGRLPEGHAVRVLTGAALPDGVDTVVLQEDVTVTQGQIAFHGPVKEGANTRKAGEDIAQGQPVLRWGQTIRAPELALLAATGIGQIEAREMLNVAVLSTGDELVPAGGNAQPGQIFDANRPMLLDLIDGFGHRGVDMGCVGDDRDALRKRLDQAAAQADVIITSGGASAGDEDHVSALLRETGAMTLWRIAIKPGRPLALGLWNGKPVFGLPGNPVAALVCALIFARPAMARLAGADWPEPQGFDVPAAFAKTKKAGRSEYLRARMCDGAAQVFPSEGSGRISGLSWATGLVELPPPAQSIQPGDKVRFIPFSSFGIKP
jgi:molybdopterin molybdotransferase